MQSFNAYGKYLTMVIKMAVFIAGGVYGGLYLDELAGSQNKLYTIIGSLLGIGLAIYSVIRDILYANRDKTT